VGVAAAQFSGDGTVLALARVDGLFDVWDVPSRAMLRRFQLPDVDNFGFAMLSVARDGSTLAVSPTMGRLAVWDLDSGRQLLSLPADATRWGRMALSPGGDRLARSGHLPVEVWDVETGRQLGRMDSVTIDPLEIVWAPDGGRLALAPNSYDALPDNLFLPSVMSRRDRASLNLAPGYGASALAFSPDGRYLAGALVAPVRDPVHALPQPRAVPDVWDWRAGRARFERPWPLPDAGHVRGISCIAWSPDGRRLATGSLDGSILFWDAETGARLGRAEPPLAPSPAPRKQNDSYFLQETPGEEE
jgi:WD40 repeat protein